MKTITKILTTGLFLGLTSLMNAQDITELKLNPEKVKKFTPYVEFRHGGPQSFAAWKENNKLQYAKEMWYYSESFYVKRNVSSEGTTLDESIIDVTRFEAQRKAGQEVTINLPGFKDAIVLLPGDKLIYKL